MVPVEFRADLVLDLRDAAGAIVLAIVLEGKRDVLLRLIARVGVPLGEEDRARILACTDGATLDRWLDNVLGAKGGADVLA